MIRPPNARLWVITDPRSSPNYAREPYTTAKYNIFWTTQLTWRPHRALSSRIDRAGAFTLLLPSQEIWLKESLRGKEMLACYGSDRPAMALVSAWKPVGGWNGWVWGRL